MSKKIDFENNAVANIVQSDQLFLNEGFFSEQIKRIQQDTSDSEQVDSEQCDGDDSVEGGSIQRDGSNSRDR